MLASLLMAFFRYPVQGLIILGGASLLAPVVLPMASFLIRPLVKPVTNFYLDLAEDVSEVVKERQQLKEGKGKKVGHKEDLEITEGLEKAVILGEVLDTL